MRTATGHPWIASHLVEDAVLIRQFSGVRFSGDPPWGHQHVIMRPPPGGRLGFDSHVVPHLNMGF